MLSMGSPKGSYLTSPVDTERMLGSSPVRRALLRPTFRDGVFCNPSSISKLQSVLIFYRQIVLFKFSSISISAKCSRCMQVDMNIRSIKTCVGIMHVVDAVLIPAPEEDESVGELSDLGVAAEQQVGEVWTQG